MPKRRSIIPLEDATHLFEEDFARSSRPQSNPEELSSITDQPSTLMTRSLASESVYFSSDGSPYSSWPPWVKNALSNYVTLDRRTIEEHESPSPVLQNSIIPERNQNKSEIQPNISTGDSEFKSHDFDATDELFDMKSGLDDSRPILLHSDEDTEGGDSHLMPAEKRSGKEPDMNPQMGQQGSAPQVLSAPNPYTEALRLQPGIPISKSVINCPDLNINHEEVVDSLLAKDTEDPTMDEFGDQAEEGYKSYPRPVNSHSPLPDLKIPTRSERSPPDLLHCSLCSATFTGRYAKGNFGRHIGQIHGSRSSRGTIEPGIIPRRRSIDSRFPSPDSTTSTTSVILPSNPLKCPSCSTSFVGKFARGNLSRHKRHFHGKETVPPAVKCVVEGCGRSYSRRDALLKHYRSVHSEFDITQINFPSRVLGSEGGPLGTSEIATADTRRSLLENETAEIPMSAILQESQEVEETQQHEIIPPEREAREAAEAAEAAEKARLEAEENEAAHLAAEQAAIVEPKPVSSKEKDKEKKRVVVEEAPPPSPPPPEPPAEPKDDELFDLFKDADPHERLAELDQLTRREQKAVSSGWSSAWGISLRKNIIGPITDMPVKPDIEPELEQEPEPEPEPEPVVEEVPEEPEPVVVVNMNPLSAPPNLHQASINERASITNTNLVEEDDYGLGRHYPEIIPASPSYASSVASVFSQQSSVSSATDLSRSSGYSARQIESATMILLAVFKDDTSLSPLYKNAMNDPRIGPDRLRRNLCRIFKAYSKHLETEAKEILEFLTSRLVRMQSSLLANSIVESLQTAPVTRCSSSDEHKNESSDEEDDGNPDTHPVNEEAFEDLEVFREFLVKSEAFQILHTQVQAFVTGKTTQTIDESTMENGNPPANDALRQCLAMPATQARKSLIWQNWIEDVAQTIDALLRDTSITHTANAMLFLFTDAFMLATDDIFIALGQLEPPLKPGMKRLRWRSSCGNHLYSDVLELREGGVSELTGHMQRTSGVKVHVSSYDQQNSVQRYVAPRPMQWIQSAGRKIWAALGRATQLSTLLPRYNTQRYANASTTPNNTSSSSNNSTRISLNGNSSSTPNNNSLQQNTLRLLACIHRNQKSVRLVQASLDNITDDRAFLCLLRKQYVCHRDNILRMVSLKSIKGVHLVKFRLPMIGSVIVDRHERYCGSASPAQRPCHCLPPVSRLEPPLSAEYLCHPVPPGTNPPIPPEWLLDAITCPQDNIPNDVWILNQVPRRKHGELQKKTGEAVEGWGVYYQEDWDHDMIMLAILIVLIVASLLFGILWSQFKFDLQGAFGVSAYITGVCAVFIAVVARYADKKY